MNNRSKSMRTFSLVCGIKRRVNRTDPVEIVPKSLDRCIFCVRFGAAWLSIIESSTALAQSCSEWSF
jgi:hypothetical protein